MKRYVLTIVATLLLSSLAHASESPDEVYGRLIAPCCWNQTLDIHDSELATQLRGEISERLARGESSLSIEDDIASRFGERVRAVPRASDPRQSMALSIALAMVAALLSLFGLAFRWTRRRVHAVELGAERDEYDARLDRELSRD
jgi:cytochrome c-type biogenesis protein CcmH